MQAVETGMHGELAVEVHDLPHLRKVIKAIGRVKGVLSVERRESFQQTDLSV